MPNLTNAGEWTTVAETFVLGALVGALAAVATATAVDGGGVTATDATVAAGTAVAVLAWTHLPRPARRARRE